MKQHGPRAKTGCPPCVSSVLSLVARSWCGHCMWHGARVGLCLRHCPLQPFQGMHWIWPVDQPPARSLIPVLRNCLDSGSVPPPFPSLLSTRWDRPLVLGGLKSTHTRTSKMYVNLERDRALALCSQHRWFTHNNNAGLLKDAIACELCLFIGLGQSPSCSSNCDLLCFK